MVESTAKRRPTYEDLLKLPEHILGEIIAGELITSPRPSPRHAHSASSLGDELISSFQKGRDGPGGWIILLEPELHLDDHVMVPDVAGWKKERLQHPPEGNGITVSPDWVCEVISPASVRTDRVLKMPRYAEAQIKHLWLNDPIARTLEVFRLDGDGWRVISSHGDNDKVRVEPFQDIELSLSVLSWE